jgi:hypothetical protein
MGLHSLVLIVVIKDSWNIMETKKKKAIVSIKKLKKSDNDITAVDSVTFYVKSSEPDKEPYMVFNSISKGFLCDCMSFVMNLEDSGKNKGCKHITKVLAYIEKNKK